MSESRREALKLSVLGALGLTGCGQNGQRAQRGMRLLAVQPVNEEQLPDILIQTKDANVGGSWVLLQYNNVNHNYDVSRNKEPLPTTRLAPGKRPDLSTVTSGTEADNWEPFPYSQGVPILGTDDGSGKPIKLPVKPQDSTFVVKSDDVKDFLHQYSSALAQTAWNEIGKQ